MRELVGLLEHCGGDHAPASGGGGGGGAAAVEVAVVREEQMRTQGGAATEGTATCKNAVILGRKVGGRLGRKALSTSQVH